MDLLIFSLAAEWYGVPLPDVHEVLRAVAVTRVPGLPHVVAGVVDVRGEPTPVFDLRRRVGLPRRAVAPEDHFIRARAAERNVLLHVDRVDRVASVDASALTPIDALTESGDAVAGVARLPDGLVLIHDLRAFLSPAEAAALDDAMRDGLEAGEPGS